MSDTDWFVYAPYGLDDMFNMKIKANPVQITEAIYNDKVAKWTAKWPNLTYEEWTGVIYDKVYTEAVAISL